MNRRSSIVAFALASITLGVDLAQAQVSSRQRLKQNYTSVRFHEVGERVRAVYGTQMTRGNTPREAAESWLKEYGDVFGAAPLELKEHQEMALDRRGRWAYLYNQTMDNLPVIGTSLRVLVQEGTPSHVMYAAGRIAIRPEGGLPRATVTADDALWAAKAHRTGLGLANWGQPELVVIYDDAPRGNGEAYPAWKCVGGNAGTIETYSFYVDGLTGVVVRVHSNLMHAFDITGTVKGNATPAGTTFPETLGPDTWDGTSAECPNDAILTNLEGVTIFAYDSQTQSFVASATTASDGSYTLSVPNGVQVNLKAHLIGPGSEVYADTWDPYYPVGVDLWGEPLPPLTLGSVTAPASAQNFNFGSDQNAGEFDIAYGNAHKHLTATWNHLSLDSDQLPSIPLIVNSDYFHDVANASSAGYLEEGYCGDPANNCPDPSGFVPWPGRLLFSNSDGGNDPNAAYSTVISHEYGHYVLDVAFGIGYVGNTGFHEGFSDVLALLVHDTRVIAQDFGGCADHVREPWEDNLTYPECSIYGHIRGEVLGKVWLNILVEMRALYGQTTGLTETRDLHRAWMPIAQAPGGHPLCTIADQSASPVTLIEVLVADSPNDDPADAPHIDEICKAFFDQDIFYEPLCGESARRLCYADCDGSGTLDVFDFLCFQDAFVAASLSSDCDGDGQLNMFDFMCFQSDFAAGCS